MITLLLQLTIFLVLLKVRGNHSGFKQVKRIYLIPSKPEYKIATDLD